MVMLTTMVICHRVSFDTTSQENSKKVSDYLLYVNVHYFSLHYEIELDRLAAKHNSKVAMSSDSVSSVKPTTSSVPSLKSTTTSSVKPTMSSVPSCTGLTPLGIEETLHAGASNCSQSSSLHEQVRIQFDILINFSNTLSIFIH